MESVGLSTHDNETTTATIPEAASINMFGLPLLVPVWHLVQVAELLSVCALALRFCLLLFNLFTIIMVG